MELFQLFFPKPELRPYETEAEAADEILAVIDAYLNAAFEIKDAWDENLELRGLVITPGECRDALLYRIKGYDVSEAKMMRFRELSVSLNKMMEYVWKRGGLKTDYAKDSPGIWQIVRCFHLTKLEALCFFLALACDYDRKYERLFGYLQDNIAAKRPTLGLAIALHYLGREDDKDWIGRESPLCQYLLCASADCGHESRLSLSLVVNDLVWSYVREGAWFTGRWKKIAGIVENGREEGNAEGGSSGFYLWISETELKQYQKEAEKTWEDLLAGPAAAAKINAVTACILEQEMAFMNGEPEGAAETVTQHLLNILKSYGLKAEVVQKSSHAGLHMFATKVKMIYGWEDLILEELNRSLLRQICDQVRYRDLVKNQWGFGAKSPYGNGISALFYGSPGTGKTMAAQVMAKELGLSLYKVDVSRLLSKYIGETEKHMSELFSEAAASQAVLFFDEADGLFAKRSEVGNSNDRYANMETGYLLQRFEEYDGITILATNYVNNIDEAFKRRIRFLVRFNFPPADMRLKLWKSMLPHKARVDEPLNFLQFADDFELSGSSIKEVVTGAAFLAAGECRGIKNVDIINALKTHYLKYGKHLTEIELGKK